MTITIICQACGEKTATDPYTETAQTTCECGAENFGYPEAVLAQMLRGRDFDLVKTTRERKR